MKIKNLLFILIAITLFSCDSLMNTSDETAEEDCTKTQTAFVSEVNGEEQMDSGNALDLEVLFPVINGCGQFNRFIETSEGKTLTLEVEAIYKGCMCTMDIPTRKATYTFKPSEKGTYTLRFKSADTGYLEKIITVN